MVMRVISSMQHQQVNKQHKILNHYLKKICVHIIYDRANKDIGDYYSFNLS